MRVYYWVGQGCVAVTPESGPELGSCSARCTYGSIVRPAYLHLSETAVRRMAPESQAGVGAVRRGDLWFQVRQGLLSGTAVRRQSAGVGAGVKAVWRGAYYSKRDLRFTLECKTAAAPQAPESGPRVGAVRRGAGDHGGERAEPAPDQALRPPRHEHAARAVRLLGARACSDPCKALPQSASGAQLCRICQAFRCACHHPAKRCP